MSGYAFDDFNDDYGDDYEPDYEDEDVLQDHELFLYEYSPEAKEAEDSTAVDVLKVADMTIKLVDALKLRLNRAEMDR